jgi:hypothetical protein
VTKVFYHHFQTNLTDLSSCSILGFFFESWALGYEEVPQGDSFFGSSKF